MVRRTTSLMFIVANWKGSSTHLPVHFARCTLGLYRHSPAILLKYIMRSLLALLGTFQPNMLTIREMQTYQKLDFLRFFFIVVSLQERES